MAAAEVTIQAVSHCKCPKDTLMNGTSHESKAALRKESRARLARGTHRRAFPLILDLVGTLGIGADARRVRSYFEGLKSSQPFLAQPCVSERTAEHRDASSRLSVAQNDIVVLDGRRGTWKVVAAVNGTKADIRRRGSFDTRIVTALVENLTVVHRAGSPGAGY
jgi:hypothetical protein